MKVLVVDDDPDVIDVVNLCFSLRWPEAEVLAARDADEALKLIEDESPDLILLDIVLPGMDGFQICQEVRGFSDVPIVILTARDTEVDKVPAIGEVFESGDLRIDYGSRAVTVRGQSVRLTPTEYSLLFHLTRNAGRVLPHHTLLAKVWGREYVDEIDYLKVYVRRLRQKLEGDPETMGRIVSERGVGYKFVAA